MTTKKVATKNKLEKDIKFFHDIICRLLNIKKKQIVNFKKTKDIANNINYRVFSISYEKSIGSHFLKIISNLDDTEIVSIKLVHSLGVNPTDNDNMIKSKVDQELHSPSAKQILEHINKTN